jgi:hypothetical protein
VRHKIHEILDPLWRTKKFTRKTLYGEISKRLGYRYHTATIKDVPEARRVYRVIQQIARGK